jgi:shikimate dehydrogenase
MKKLMKINTDTNLFFSISSSPSNKGSSLHNFIFEKYHMNSIYIPLAVNNLKSFLIFAKDLNIAGFSVSMPFKTKIIKFLSKKSTEVLLTNSCNTVVLENSKLIGYNTDYIAVEKILKKYKKFKNKKIQILGYGATCKTVIIVLKKLGFKDINVFARNRKVKNKKNYSLLSWNDRNQQKFDILINTTPIGMNRIKVDKCPITMKSISQKKVIIDFPIASKKITSLELESKKLGIKYYSGKDIHFLQGVSQSQIYLKKKIGSKIQKMIKKKLY